MANKVSPNEHVVLKWTICRNESRRPSNWIVAKSRWSWVQLDCRFHKIRRKRTSFKKSFRTILPYDKWPFTFIRSKRPILLNRTVHFRDHSQQWNFLCKVICTHFQLVKAFSSTQKDRPLWTNVGCFQMLSVFVRRRFVDREKVFVKRIMMFLVKGYLYNIIRNKNWTSGCEKDLQDPEDFCILLESPQITGFVFPIIAF